jgi:lysophospholipase L1-like esterase
VSRARRIAARAAYGTGGVGAAGALTAGVLWAEAQLARRMIGEVSTPPPTVDGDYGGGPGEPLRLDVLGDSAAAGWGVSAAEAFPAVFARLLSDATGRPVRLRCVAVVGAQTGDLAAQRRPADDPANGTPAAAAAELTVVVVGANDITHLAPLRRSAAALHELLVQLLAEGSTVVVGTCPDLGTIRPVKHPLRLVLRHRSRQLADVQTATAVAAGAVSVSLRDLLGEEFATRPGELFHTDQFHPSALGYRRMAEALLPGALVALGLTDEAPHVAGGAMPIVAPDG